MPRGPEACGRRGAGVCGRGRYGASCLQSPWGCLAHVEPLGHIKAERGGGGEAGSHGRVPGNPTL